MDGASLPERAPDLGEAVAERSCLILKIDLVVLAASSIGAGLA